MTCTELKTMKNTSKPYFLKKEFQIILLFYALIVILYQIVIFEANVDNDDVDNDVLATQLGEIFDNSKFQNENLEIVNETEISSKLLKNQTKNIADEIDKTKPPQLILSNSLGLSNLLNPKLNHFNLYDYKTKALDQKYFAPYNITKNPVSEARACLIAEADCQVIDETKIGWNTIPRDIFKKVIKNPVLHTAPDNSVVEVAKELNKKQDNKYFDKTEITLNLLMKNGKNKTKTYGGDFIMARMIQTNSEYKYNLPYKKYLGPQIPNGIDPHNFYNFVRNSTQSYDKQNIFFIGSDVKIPGVVNDFNNGTYQIILPLRWPGKFKIQIFLMRKSETCSALIYGMNTIHRKSRVIKGIFDYKNAQSELCGMFLPDLLPGGDFNNVCNFTEKYGAGNEWYCQKPENWRIKYPNFKCDDWPVWHGDHTGAAYGTPKWRFGEEVTEEFELDRGFEDLIFEKEISVLENPEDSSKKLEIIKFLQSFQNSPGYWKNYTWYDKVLPSNHPDPGDEDSDFKTLNYGKIMTNKNFIRMGDSLTGHVSQMFDLGMKYYNRELNRKELENQEKSERANNPPGKTQHNFQFLGYENMYSSECEPVSGWGAVMTKFNYLNASGIYISEGMPISKDVCIGKSLYSSDAIRRMKEYKNEWFGERNIILMTHGAHFSSWHPIVFYNRLIAIRDAILAFKQEERKHLKKNDKGAIFIYKTPNYVRGDFKIMYAAVSGFNMFRQREIAFKVFGNPYLEDTKKDNDKFPVKVFDQFAPTFYAFDTMKPGNVHPPTYLRDMSSYMLADLLNYYGYC